MTGTGGNGNGRVGRPGRYPFPPVVQMVLVVLAALTGGSLAGCGSGSVRSVANPDNTYGPLPGWLPRSSVPVNRVEVASAKDPKLGIEGDTIKAVLPNGQTLVTLSGPAIPPFVTPPPPVTTATFTISMSHTYGTVPIRAVDFELVDGTGKFLYPQVFSGDKPPPLAPVGTTISFEITEPMATGAGSIRWAPDGVPIATWDFTVEND